MESGSETEKVRGRDLIWERSVAMGWGTLPDLNVSINAVRRGFDNAAESDAKESAGTISEEVEDEEEEEERSVKGEAEDGTEEESDDEVDGVCVVDSDRTRGTLAAVKAITVLGTRALATMAEPVRTHESRMWDWDCKVSVDTSKIDSSEEGRVE